MNEGGGSSIRSSINNPFDEDSIESDDTLSDIVSSVGTEVGGAEPDVLLPYGEGINPPPLVAAAKIGRAHV